MTSYAEAGVRGQGDALSSVLEHLGPTLADLEGAEMLTRFGHYAAVVKLGDDLAIAVSTDGVGSKTVVASALGRYDTIGIDCVAMNVNDVLCVGARPVLLVDYFGVHRLDGATGDRILKGLARGAREAGIAVPGGEIAQLPEVLGPSDDAFDLVGTCVGVVHPRRLVLGDDVREGDAVLGIASSGIHSNGLTLARKVLLERAGLRLDEHVPSIGRTLGDELLEPTRIYVRAVRALWDAGIRTHALAHITGDGLANLCRLDSPVGFVVDDLPPPQPIFELVRRAGDIAAEEMFRVFNMGVGFVAIVPQDATDLAIRLLEAAGYRARRIGRASGPRGTVQILPEGLTATLEDGDAVFRRR